MNRTKGAAAALACAALTISLAACGGASSASGSSGGTLTVGMAETAASMNPAINPLTGYLYFSYDPLIYQTADGQLVPDLATSWHYVGTANKTFEFTLRQGLKFSDGSPVTAAAVAASMNYFLKVKGAGILLAGPVASVTAISADTVQIDYQTSFPDAVLSLSQDHSFGLIIGPKGLANPKSLESTSDGAGHYVMEASQTVADSVYTFVPDKYYFNQAAIKYQKVQLKPITDPASLLNALRSGQIQYAQNLSAAEAVSARSSGFIISQGAARWYGIGLQDRTSRPLNNLTVRQALQYAINRKAIIKAVWEGYATPKYQFTAEGFSGYLASENTRYSYDPAKARELLARAGYPHGFTLSLIDAGQLDPNGVFAQAISSQLAAIGVTVNVTLVSTNFSVFSSDIASRKYPTVVGGSNIADTYSTASQYLAPGPPDNAFNENDATASRLLVQAAAAAPAAAKSGFEQLNQWIDEQSWVVPIATQEALEVTVPTVHGVASTYKTVDVDPVSPVTAQNWYSSGS
jgi:peptide/nickel transport system substrate-binding protein